jgi:hypothetical protein
MRAHGAPRGLGRYSGLLCMLIGDETLNGKVMSGSAEFV